jgi:acyl-CoA reductase-like NAD-dependent aldehyde dehydrogenase
MYIATDPPSTYTMTIGGQAVGARDCIETIDPASELVIATVPDAGADQLDAAVDAARQAFPSWSSTPLSERQASVAKVAAVLMANQESLARLLTREQGKPLQAARDEIAAAAYWCVAYARLSPPVETIEDSEKHWVQLRHVPLGVVGAIVPWNFPVALAVWKIAPALIAGNTVVLKPSPFTPLTTLRLGELLRPVLAPGVLNVISGGDALGPRMSAHEGIDKISFTGSTATGRSVMHDAAGNLKRLTLELGGNDAAIVMPDVNVEELASVLFWGAFTNSGQFCMAIKRLYLHEDIYDRMQQALVKLAGSVTIGPGDAPDTQLGPVQNRRQWERLKSLVAHSRQQGHRFLAGGEIDADRRGFFFPVTLVDNPPDDSRVVREEPFGPVLPLLRFTSVDEVVARANSSPYGLGGSVWCRNAGKARAIAERLQTGTVWINEIHYIGPDKPIAGHKQSGLGIENGLHGLLEYTAVQTLSQRRLP